MTLHLRHLVLVVSFGACLALGLTAGGVAQESDGAGAHRGSRSSHASMTQGIPCSRCHTPEGWSMSGDGEGFDHSRTGFPLAGRHAVAGCVDCHREGEDTRRACVTCHEDQHRRRVTQRCEQCHTSNAWNDTAPFDLHRNTRFPLDGMHALADCTECHRRAADGIFTGAPANCFGCHADLYRDPDLHPVHRGSPGAAPFPRDCRLCHRTNAWDPAFPSPVVFGLLSEQRTVPAVHQLRFPLRGGHATAGCDDCHADAERRPRAVSCDGCHSRAQLIRQHEDFPSIATGPGVACLRCHVGGARR